jgi:hypothetical protein
MGGFFSQSGATSLNGIARFDGAQWLPLGTGLAAPGGFHPEATCAAVLGTTLVIGGLFESAGGIPAHGIASWDGAAWHAFTNDLFAFSSLAVHAGSLYAGGYFPTPGNPYVGIVRWNGQAWVTAGQDYPRGDVLAMTTYRGQLVAGGAFTIACCGNPPAPGDHIAVFDGVSWRPLGSGLDGPVFALTSFDPDASGPLPEFLIAGGNFTSAGGQPANNIAMWDGAHWMPMGPGASSNIRALTVWNNLLVVGGDFYTAGGLMSPGMAFWGCPPVSPGECYPNCDGSTVVPVLNIADFVCFLNAFAAVSPYANCDSSSLPPILNVADFICFLNKYARGCP